MLSSFLPLAVFLLLVFPHFAGALDLTVGGAQEEPAPSAAAPPPAAQDKTPPAPAVSDEAKREANRKAIEAGRLVAEGDWRRARELARQAVAADPENPQTHYALGLTFEAEGDLAGAEAEYRRMGVYAPEPLLEISLARIYLRQGRISDAERQARRAVERNRWVPQPHMSLGAVLMRKSDYNGAVDSFKAAVEADPRNLTARLSLADAYRDAGHLDEALAEYAEALTLQPGQPEALLGRAETWERMGRPREAVVAYEKALEAQPQSLLAEYKLARLYLMASDPDLRKPQRAVKLALAAAEQTKWQNRTILETLAQAYAQAGDLARSTDVREKAKALPETK